MAGLGRWTETVYYNLLNCGLRIPPTAGSGSGVAPNPVGYNRIYVHVKEPFNYERWLESLCVGRVVVTNGPLIRPDVAGELPGFVFRADGGQEVELDAGLTLSTRDPVSYLEIVQNGRTVHQVRLDQWAKEGGKLPPIRFRESGWFVMRAVCDLGMTYRFASTGPYYVEISNQKRISRAAVQFFLDWLDPRKTTARCRSQPGGRSTGRSGAGVLARSVGQGERGIGVSALAPQSEGNGAGSPFSSLSALCGTLLGFFLLRPQAP